MEGKLNLSWMEAIPKKKMYRNWNEDNPIKTSQMQSQIEDEVCWNWTAGEYRSKSKSIFISAGKLPKPIKKLLTILLYTRNKGNLLQAPFFSGRGKMGLWDFFLYLCTTYVYSILSGIFYRYLNDEGITEESQTFIRQT